MTMILTSVTMVGLADVPDSERGDFRRQRAVDISSLIMPNRFERSMHVFFSALIIVIYVYIIDMNNLQINTSNLLKHKLWETWLLMFA